MVSTLNHPGKQTVPDRPISELLKDDTAIQTALDRGYYRAVLRHRAGNVPMISMRDGEIVEVGANDIAIPPEILAQIQVELESLFP